MRSIIIILAFASVASSADAEIYCPSGDPKICGAIERMRDGAAEAIITAYFAQNECTDLEVDPNVIGILQRTHGLFNADEFKELRNKVGAVFDADQSASCTLAMDLYGPNGRAVVYGPMIIGGALGYRSTVTGLIRKRRSGGFLKESGR